MGAGKTTAIRAISDAPPVSTEVANTDQATVAKATTTVMWEILCRGAIGVVLLIDGSTPTAREDLRTYAEAFRRINPHQPFVIGVGRVPGDEPVLDEYARALAVSGIVAPVFGVDVRNREDVLLLIETLLCVLEAQTFEATNADH
jgi:signal recognition particle receptor subunit beta